MLGALNHDDGRIRHKAEFNLNILYENNLSRSIIGLIKNPSNDIFFRLKSIESHYIIEIFSCIKKIPPIQVLLYDYPMILDPELLTKMLKPGYNHNFYFVYLNGVHWWKIYDAEEDMEVLKCMTIWYITRYLQNHTAQEASAILVLAEYHWENP